MIDIELVHDKQSVLDTEMWHIKLQIQYGIWDMKYSVRHEDGVWHIKRYTFHMKYETCHTVLVQSFFLRGFQLKIPLDFAS